MARLGIQVGASQRPCCASNRRFSMRASTWTDDWTLRRSPRARESLPHQGRSCISRSHSAPLPTPEFLAEGITRDQSTRAQADADARDQRLMTSAGPPSNRAILKHAKHESFSDEPLLLNSGDANIAGLMRLARMITLEFFDTTVKDRGDVDCSAEQLRPRARNTWAPASPMIGRRTRR